jgi:8-oxo-dGTP pyrophosphatase MutT (NUDIX family)
MTSQKHSCIPEAYLVIRRGNEVLLLQRANTGYNDGNYSLVAGHVDAGEPATVSALREAMEEAAITIDPAHVECVLVMHRREEDERIGFFFHVTEWSGDITNAEPHKCTELRWFPINELPENTIPYIRHALERIEAGETYSEFGW